MSVQSSHEFTLALLRAAGLPTEDVVRVVYLHDVGGRPTFRVTFQAWDADVKQLVETTTRFEVKP
jgi:hypothetical protein